MIEGEKGAATLRRHRQNSRNLHYEYDSSVVTAQQPNGSKATTGFLHEDWIDSVGDTETMHDLVVEDHAQWVPPMPITGYWNDAWDHSEREVNATFGNSWAASGSRDLDVTTSGTTTANTAGGSHTTTWSGDERTLETGGSYGVINTESTFVVFPLTSSSVSVTETPDGWLFPPLPIVGIRPLTYLASGWVHGTTESLRWYLTPPLQQIMASSTEASRAPTPWVTTQCYLIPLKLQTGGATSQSLSTYFEHPGPSAEARASYETSLRAATQRGVFDTLAADRGGQWQSELGGTERIRNVEDIRGLHRGLYDLREKRSQTGDEVTNPWSTHAEAAVWPAIYAKLTLHNGVIPLALAPTVNAPPVPHSEIEQFADTLEHAYQSEAFVTDVDTRDRSLLMPPRTVADATPQLNGWLAQHAQTAGALKLNDDTLRRADSGKFDDGGREETKKLADAYKTDPLPVAAGDDEIVVQAPNAAVKEAFEKGQQERQERPYEKVEEQSNANLPAVVDELDTNALKVAREELERKLQEEYGKTIVRWRAAQTALNAPISWSDWFTVGSIKIRKQREKELKEAIADMNGAQLALNQATGRTDFNPKFFAGDEAATWSYTRKLYESLKYAITNNLFGANLLQQAKDFRDAISDPLGASQILGAMAAGYAIKKGVCKIAAGRPTSPVALYASAVLSAGELMAMALKIEAVRKELDAITFRSEVSNAAPHVVALVVEVLQDHVFMNWVRKFTCFVAGTQVVTAVVRDAEAPNGVRYVTKNIEDVRIGDVVYARDEFGTALGPQRVTETYRSSVGHLHLLTFTDGSGRTQTLRATHEHPIWVVNRNEFVPARLLETGDIVCGPSGERQTLTSNAVEYHPDGVSVYNFTVADWHTYFVSATANDAPLLVHNKCGIDTFRDSAKRITKVKADVKHSDLYSGSPTNQKARDYARAQGDPKDDAGHLIAKRLGGDAEVDNIVGMNRKLNRGRYSQFEKKVAEKLEKLGEAGWAKIEVELKYDGASMRPKEIIYKVSFSDGTPFAPARFPNLAN